MAILPVLRTKFCQGMNIFKKIMIIHLAGLITTGFAIIGTQKIQLTMKQGFWNYGTLGPLCCLIHSFFCVPCAPFFVKICKTDDCFIYRNARSMDVQAS